MKVFASLVLANAVSAVLIESTVDIQTDEATLLSWANTSNFSAKGLDPKKTANCYVGVS